MKNYDTIVGNYGIVMEYNSKGKLQAGHIDYIGKNNTRKTNGNGFIAGHNNIRYDFPFQVPKYVHNALLKLV